MILDFCYKVAKSVNYCAEIVRGRMRANEVRFSQYTFSYSKIRWPDCYEGTDTGIT